METSHSIFIPATGERVTEIADEAEAKKIQKNVMKNGIYCWLIYIN